MIARGGYKTRAGPVRQFLCAPAEQSARVLDDTLNTLVVMTRQGCKLTHGLKTCQQENM